MTGDILLGEQISILRQMGRNLCIDRLALQGVVLGYLSIILPFM